MGVVQMGSEEGWLIFGAAPVSQKPHNETRGRGRLPLPMTWGATIHESGECAICGRTQNLEAHHIIHRHRRTTRTDPRNGILLCREHHRGKQSAHNSPRWFLEWLDEHRPEVAAWAHVERNRLHTRGTLENIGPNAQDTHETPINIDSNAPENN
jgi:hypothetical protein